MDSRLRSSFTKTGIDLDQTKTNESVLNILLNFSVPSDCKKMINSSLESPHRDESNGSKIIFLGAIDRDLSNNLSF
uniref:Uncharacterized protein n=1 Tax=Rhizophagus irregularis (strain DAOM 181602 / DAOM 197198 / MUCL 43194) TaxID=747089 RepID=U9SLG0_RHIID